jgi:hypothetical protein
LILDRTHAFADPSEAESGGIPKMLPTPAILADAALALTGATDIGLLFSGGDRSGLTSAAGSQAKLPPSAVRG